MCLSSFTLMTLFGAAAKPVLISCLIPYKCLLRSATVLATARTNLLHAAMACLENEEQAQDSHQQWAPRPVEVSGPNAPC